MAYSDYGGYAYRNGIRVEDRSDCTITPEGDTFGTPGMWPGFGMLIAGVSPDDVGKRIQWPSGHAVLGDGPIYVVMYKQSTLLIHRGPEELNAIDFLHEPPEGAIENWTDDNGKEHRYLKTDHFRTTEKACTFMVDGWKIEAYFLESDNYYQYAKVTQPDGTVWTGFSGYGVGAGLEDAGYGYSTDDCIDEMNICFPPERTT